MFVSADGYIFATPENLAAMAGRMKDFFDRTYYPALDRINGRPYATLICAGSDGENAARQIARIATGWRLRPVAAPLIVCTHAQTPEAILAPKTIGSGGSDGLPGDRGGDGERDGGGDFLNADARGWHAVPSCHGRAQPIGVRISSVGRTACGDCCPLP